MARKRHKFPSRPPRKQYNLDGISDTSETSASESSEPNKTQNEYDEFYKVPPPFKGKEGEGSKPITWNDLKFSSKIFAIIFAFFVMIVIPSVWYASRVETNINTIQSDILEIKKTTKELTKTTIKNTDRLDHIEKSVHYLTHRIDNRFDSEEKKFTKDRESREKKSY